MTHLRIEQNNGVIEEVSSSVITKLYEIAHAGLDVSSNLQGRLHSPLGIRSQIQWLTTTYPDLYINVDDYAIEFEDPKVVTYLNSIGVGSNGIVTEAQAAAATVAANSQNTEITKFNELRYFTNITTSKGGWTGTGQSGSIRFREWTALEEIDISNITALGHTQSNYDDTFYGCTSLKRVTTNGNLAKIGYKAFAGCSNLEQITGLSGDIQVSLEAFKGCTKLPQSTIQNCTFSFVGTRTENGSDDALANTKFTQVNLSDGVDFIPAGFCNGNDQLQSVTGGTIIKVRSYAFYYCSKLTSFDFSNVEAIEGCAFDHCDLTGTLSIPNLQTLSGNYIFSNNKHISAVNIDWSNLTNSGPTQGIFYQCTALPTIDLTGATAIGGGAFQGCSGLTTVTGLSDCRTIDGNVFRDCSNLTTIDLSNVETIGQQAFMNCPGLTSVNLSSLSSVGAEPFVGSNNIQTVTLTKSCENISRTLFNPNIQGITTVNVSDIEQWSSFNRHAFPVYGNTCPYDVLPFSNATTGIVDQFGLCAISSSSIYQLYLPKLQTVSADFETGYKRLYPLLGASAQEYLSRNHRFKTRLLYLKDIQTLKENCFAGLVCNALVINNTTPPTCTTQYYATYDEFQHTATNINIDTWGNMENASDSTQPINVTRGNYSDGKSKVLQQIDNIYVPDSVVNTYKTASGWSAVASKIKGISELNGGVTYPTKAAWEAAGKPLALIDEYM